MIRVALADDSKTFTLALTRLLGADRDISIVGTAANGQAAVDLAREVRPDILILDYQMPVLDGLEALRVIMRDTPLPVVMLSALTREGAAVTLRALELGAVDYFPKPSTGQEDPAQFSRDLIGKIKEIVSHGNGLNSSSAQPAAPLTTAGQQPRLASINRRPVEVVAVGSSTGGVQAALKILSQLPADCRPLLWVQHMPAAFMESFVRRLNDQSPLLVKEAEDGEPLRPGVCYMGPAGVHLLVERQGPQVVARLGEGQQSALFHCPSCDELFASVARTFADRAVGVILTGMGNDGAQGLLAMHQHGAFVLGQDAASSAVYGMAKAAGAAGAVDLEVGIDSMAEAIVRVGAGPA